MQSQEEKMRPILAQEPLVEQRLETTLSQLELASLTHWRERSRGKCSMLTYRFREGTTPISRGEYRHNNQDYADWLNWYCRRETEHLKGTIRPDEFCVQYSIGPHALALDYLKQMKDAGFSLDNIRLVDWLPVALRVAKKKLSKIFFMDPHSTVIENMVAHAEIIRYLRSGVIEPGQIRFSQAARVVEHSVNAAEMLYEMGKPLANPRNILVVAGAQRGRHNDHEATVTSHHYSTPFIVKHLSEGAGRPVLPIRQGKHTDLANVITALTCQAA